MQRIGAEKTPLASLPPAVQGSDFPVSRARVRFYIELEHPTRRRGVSNQRPNLRPGSEASANQSASRRDQTEARRARTRSAQSAASRAGSLLALPSSSTS
ncbi:hypothetical protein VTN02DRAFT_546 [Thermoascus thermophilus]